MCSLLNNTLNSFCIYCGNYAHQRTYSIAAIPHDRQASIVTNVFRNRSTPLTCPFQLGNLHTTLTPYSISWEVNDGRTIPIPVRDPERLSSDNTELTVMIENSNDSRTFQCSLELRRCNDGCAPLIYLGPLISFEVFGKGLYCYIDSITLTFSCRAESDNHKSKIPRNTVWKSGTF